MELLPKKKKLAQHYSKIKLLGRHSLIFNAFYSIVIFYQI